MMRGAAASTFYCAKRSRRVGIPLRMDAILGYRREIAAVSVGFARYLGAHSDLESPTIILIDVPLTQGTRSRCRRRNWAGASMIALASWTNTRGIESRQDHQNVFTTAKTARCSGDPVGL